MANEIIYKNYVIERDENGTYSAYSQLFGTNIPDFEDWTTSLAQIHREIDWVETQLNTTTYKECKITK